MSLLANDSFEELLARQGLKPCAFETNLQRMEAVELMAMVKTSGDYVLALVRQGQMSAARGEELLKDLINCFMDPIKNAKRVIEIGKELRGYK